MLLDPGATHSFVSPSFALRLGVQPARLETPLSVTTPLSDALEAYIYFPSCPISVVGRDLLADLILLDVMDFEVILGMDWLARHYAILDCREKQVIFRIPRDSEFGFRGEQIPAPSNLILAITARWMLRRGCQGYLALVRDTAVDRGKVDDVPIACEFPDVFQRSCQGCHLTGR